MVELVRSGRTPGELAREFEPSAEAIRNWVAQADRDAGKRTDGLRTEEHEEIRRLRRENQRLCEEREIGTRPDAGAVGFHRAFGKFPSWRDRQDPDNPCLKRIHVLAYSMGARVLRGALDGWAHDYGPVYGVFRNIFLVAADLVNETLDLGGPGRCLSDAARNVTVCHASDDLALRTSRITNLRHKIVSRRLGHSGPEDLSRTARKRLLGRLRQLQQPHRPADGPHVLSAGPGRRSEPGVHAPAARRDDGARAGRPGQPDAGPRMRSGPGAAAGRAPGWRHGVCLPRERRGSRKRATNPGST